MRATIPAVQDVPFGKLLQIPRRVVLIVRQKALKERGIDQMLEDARADHKEHDAEYMKPSPRSGCEFLTESDHLSSLEFANSA